MSNQFIWNRTKINFKNVRNVLLYVQRIKGHGTRPISVAPNEYLRKLSEHNITLESLNLPNSCPQYDLTETHDLSKADSNKVNETIRLLWHLIQSQTTTDSECNIRHVQSATNSSESCEPSDICMNDRIDNLSFKMDRIVRACVLDIEDENKKLKRRNATLEQESIEQKQQIQNAQQTMDNQLTQIRKLQKQRRNITNLKNYYKKVASQRRETLKCVGLVYKGNIVSMYGHKKLSKRVR
eukprot:778700_1